MPVEEDQYIKAGTGVICQSRITNIRLENNKYKVGAFAHYLYMIRAVTYQLSPSLSHQAGSITSLEDVCTGLPLCSRWWWRMDREYTRPNAGSPGLTRGWQVPDYQ